MSKIQRQVIFHVKKSSQNFSLDYGLNRLGFFKYRHYNLRDSFLRLCSKNRKSVKAQLAIPLHYKLKLLSSLSFSLKSYSAFVIRYLPRHFKTSTYRLYDVNTYSYVYFLNKLYFYLDRFFLIFSFFNRSGFIDLNTFFFFFRILYPGLPSTSLFYKLLLKNFKNNLLYQESSRINFNLVFLNFIRICFAYVSKSSNFFIKRQEIIIGLLSNKTSTTSYFKKRVNVKVIHFLEKHSLFNKISLVNNLLDTFNDIK